MGEDKSLLPFGAFNSLSEFQLSKFNKLFKEVYISCKDKKKFDFEADFIEDTDISLDYAPTAGFNAVFERLTCESFFAISVDAPFIGEEEIRKILSFDKKDNDATIARTESGLQPMCGIYHRSLKKKFTRMLQENDHKLSFLLNSSNTVFVDFEDEEAFTNLNHPHEYQKALKLLN